MYESSELHCIPQTLDTLSATFYGGVCVGVCVGGGGGDKRLGKCTHFCRISVFDPNQ